MQLASTIEALNNKHVRAVANDGRTLAKCIRQRTKRRQRSSDKLRRAGY